MTLVIDLLPQVAIPRGELFQTYPGKIGLLQLSYDYITYVIFVDKTLG